MNHLEAVLVTSPGCHYCDDALGLLDELAATMPLSIRTVPMISDEGISLVARYKVPFPPILMVDDRFFGYGRISRRKLEAHLADAAARRQVV